MEWANCLPNWVYVVCAGPYWDLSEGEQQIDYEKNDNCSSDLDEISCTILSANASLRFCQRK